MSKWTNTITMRQLITGPQTSPDGVHWEPSLPEPLWTWRARFASALDVWRGQATAVRQTPSAVLAGEGKP